ncbi:hypothetical protein [Aureibacter tunicatorum]|uniref:Uncharacterized protein n=1 Tax=Aureibacter tunicatorum TaxID=866807 RepID=A0AAE3XS09_9BACT|nr:hypothetical protein [Aureibacter tunicatorum]MDR6241028.1 hypothetical protein [Aureibacter tunicatorum]BDD03806.1 hypothetical protein AUTU_12890 [Aureibacter tunicatorum]
MRNTIFWPINILIIILLVFGTYMLKPEYEEVIFIDYRFRKIHKVDTLIYKKQIKGDTVIIEFAKEEFYNTNLRQNRFEYLINDSSKFLVYGQTAQLIDQMPTKDGAPIRKYYKSEEGYMFYTYYMRDDKLIGIFIDECGFIRNFYKYKTDSSYLYLLNDTTRFFRPNNQIINTKQLNETSRNKSGLRQ